MARHNEVDYHRLFEACPGLYLVLDPQLTIVAVSNAYLRATMTERNAILGRGIFEVFPDNPDDPLADGVGNLAASLERVRRDLIADTMAVQKYDIRRTEAAGGGFEVRFWSPVNTPVLGDNGQLEYIIHRVEDVTEFVNLNAAEQQQSQISQELRVLSSQMETEILARSQELKAANIQLREAMNAKDTFVSRMSHELRTPLNAVIGFADLLALDALRDDQQDSLHQISKAGRHLLDLINEILDLSRINAGEFSLSIEPVLAAELVNESVDLLRPLASQRRMHINAGLTEKCERYVLADRQRLKQILLNLLSNAIKYNREFGTITITYETRGDVLRVTIADTGPGIRPEDQPLLFMPFERLGADQTGIEGTGIGLVLSRRLAEAMAGKVELASSSPDGSSFFVELPLVASSPEQENAKVSGSTPVVSLSDEPNETYTIVYIEDNLANLTLVERVLARRLSVEIVPAMQGQLGIDLVRQRMPQLVLLDLHLPDIGGQEVLQRLRQDPSTASIPVVVISADATPGHIHELLDAGACAYLTKPVDIRQLVETVETLLCAQTR